MKALIIANIFLWLICLSSGAVSRGYYKDENYPGKCVMKQWNLVLSPGDIVQHPEHCGRLICQKESLVIGHTCGVIGSICKLGKPLKPEAPYPGCCEREVICDNEENNIK